MGIRRKSVPKEKIIFDSIEVSSILGEETTAIGKEDKSYACSYALVVPPLITLLCIDIDIVLIFLKERYLLSLSLPLMVYSHVIYKLSFCNRKFLQIINHANYLFSNKHSIFPQAGSSPYLWRTSPSYSQNICITIFNTSSWLLFCLQN